MTDEERAAAKKLAGNALNAELETSLGVGTRHSAPVDICSVF